VLQYVILIVIVTERLLKYCSLIDILLLNFIHHQIGRHERRNLPELN